MHEPVLYVKHIFAYWTCYGIIRTSLLQQLQIKANFCRKKHEHSQILLEQCIVKSNALHIDDFDLNKVVTLIIHIATM